MWVSSNGPCACSITSEHVPAKGDFIMRSLNRWRVATVLTAAVLVIFVVQSALAASYQPVSHHSVQNLGQNLEPPPDRITLSCNEITAVTVVTQRHDTTTTSTTFANVPGMVTSITVPAHRRACLLMRFSAETQCTTRSQTHGWCIVRILVNGVEANPAEGTDFAFDSTYNGTAVDDAWQSNAMDRSIGPLPPGAYTVVVQWATHPTSPGTITAWLGETNLTVEQAEF